MLKTLPSKGSPAASGISAARRTDGAGGALICRMAAAISPQIRSRPEMASTLSRAWASSSWPNMLSNTPLADARLTMTMSRGSGMSSLKSVRMMRHCTASAVLSSPVSWRRARAPAAER